MPERLRFTAQWAKEVKAHRDLIAGDGKKMTARGHSPAVIQEAGIGPRRTARKL